MTKIVSAPIVSSGNRIPLAPAIMRELGICVGDRVLITRSDNGDLVLKRAVV